MTSWILYAVLALLQVGLMMALFKVPAARKVNKYTLSAWTYILAAGIAGLILHSFIAFDLKTIFLSSLWGSGYAILALIQMHALHKHDTSAVFPFTSLASNILVIIGGVLFLNEAISLVQWIAVAASVLLFVGAYWNNTMHAFIEVIPVFGCIAILSTINKFIQKMGADSVEVHNFIFWQLVFAFVASLVILLVVRKQITLTNLMHRQVLGWAVLLSTLTFGSTYTIVKALSYGPISLVYVILGLYTFLTAVFAAILFKEKITAKSLLFIAASFLIVLLIKFG
jgi:uncharacterized membrane protein